MALGFIETFQNKSITFIEAVPCVKMTNRDHQGRLLSCQKIKPSNIDFLSVISKYFLTWIPFTLKEIIKASLSPARSSASACLVDLAFKVRDCRYLSGLISGRFPEV